MTIYYTIYEITNKVNGKVYIGKHKTRKLNDNYMGSGKLIKAAIEKYGIENFTKEILYVFDNESDMNSKEKEIVTEDFCMKENTYNLAPGGKGGWSYVILNGHHTKKNKDASRRMKVSKSHKGKKRSDSHKNAISKSLIGKDCFWLGKKRPEHSLKLSGGGSPTAITVEYQGIVYETIKDMSSKTNISYYLIKKMINNGKVKIIKTKAGEQNVLQY